MIAAYSGMRINEIVQLRARDIVQHNNVLCFSINRDDGKSTKNINSIRLVPVHSKLIELGLMEFVKQRASANKSIFKVSNKDFSEIFRSQIQRKLISSDKQKTFYSFRHYFIDTLVQQEVEPNIIAQIVPIKELRNTNEISQLCNSKDEPVFVTKNGYGDLVVMSIKTYDKLVATADIDSAIASSEAKITADTKMPEAKDVFASLKSKYLE